MCPFYLPKDSFWVSFNIFLLKSYFNLHFLWCRKKSSQYVFGQNLHERPLPARYAELPELSRQNVIPNSKALEVAENKESSLEGNDYEALDTVIRSSNPQEDIDDKVDVDKKVKVDLTTL